MAIVADEQRAVRDALEALPDDQRHVIELRLAGLSGPEIAGVVGRRHGAIRALQHRAFARLRVLLADLAPATQLHAAQDSPPGPETGDTR